MKKVGTLIPRLIKGLGLEEAMRFELIRREWTTVFREPLCLHMAPASLKNGALLISVDSPVWLQQISFFRSDILNSLRTFEVKEVRFRIGRVTPKKKGDETALQRQVPLGREALREIDDTVSGLEDSGLRDCVRRAMEQALRKNTGSSSGKKLR